MSNGKIFSDASRHLISDASLLFDTSEYLNLEGPKQADGAALQVSLYGKV